MKQILKIMSVALTILLCLPFGAAAQKKHRKQTAVVAHRGYWNCDQAGYAKNSLAALRCAQEAGFWGSEFDVNMTSDGVLLVYHDGAVDGKKIEKHPHSTFKYYRLKNGEPIPTIDEYLEQGKKYPQTMLVYELKKHSCDEVEDRFVDLTIEKLRAHGLLDPSRVMFISFSFHMCERLAQKLPGFTVQYLTGDKAPAKVKKAGISGIDYNHKILSANKNWVGKAKHLGMSTNTWTVNKEEQMKKMLRKGVHQITTDYPMTATELIQKGDFKKGKKPKKDSKHNR